MNVLLLDELGQSLVTARKGEAVCNVVVIGAGTAGLAAAGTVGLGGRVALVERNKMGGDCLNFGYVPSKALISSAGLIQQIQEADRGRKSGAWIHKNRSLLSIKFLNECARAAQRSRQTIRKSRFESLGVDVFRGEAWFISPHEIEVSAQPSPSGRGSRAEERNRHI